MQRHCTIPWVSIVVGRSFLSGILPSLFCWGHTLSTSSLNALASRAKKLREPMVPKSFIPNFGQPCLLLLHPPPLLQNLMVPPLSLLVRLRFHLLRYFPIRCLYRSLSPRSWGCLVIPIGRMEVPLCSQEPLPELREWQELLLALMRQKIRWEWYLASLMGMEYLVFLGSVQLLWKIDEWWDGQSRAADMKFHLHIWEVRSNQFHSSA